MILVIDYGLGNLLSVKKAFEESAEGKKVIVSRDPSDIAEATHIVLPGVGSFPAGMKKLREARLVEPLCRAVLERKKLFLGICLGMQLLAEIGRESGDTAGLGWIPGEVRMLKTGNLKLPHIGWNDLRIVKSHPLFDNIPARREFYFVHSYTFDCPKEYVAAECVYGEAFTAAAQKDNIYALQFHPEKSREAGLKVLGNFARLECYECV